jgi:hypothetical protein
LTGKKPLPIYMSDKGPVCLPSAAILLGFFAKMSQAPECREIRYS